MRICNYEALYCDTITHTVVAIAASADWWAVSRRRPVSGRGRPAWPVRRGRSTCSRLRECANGCKRRRDGCSAVRPRRSLSHKRAGNNDRWLLGAGGGRWVRGASAASPGESSWPLGGPGARRAGAPPHMSPVAGRRPLWCLLTNADRSVAADCCAAAAVTVTAGRTPADTGRHLRARPAAITVTAWWRGRLRTVHETRTYRLSPRIPCHRGGAHVPNGADRRSV